MSFNHKAAYALYKNVKSCNNNGCYDANGNKVEVDMNAINAWVDPEAYKVSREMEYPPIQDQLDDIYHNGIDGWKATIKAIKDKYPKGT